MYDDESGTQLFPVDGSTEYSYTSSYGEIRTIGARAYRNVMARKKLIGNTLSPKGRSGEALTELYNIQAAARASENAFLAKYGFTNAGNSWKELIEGINYLLGTKDSFERNINILKQVAQGDTKEYRDMNTNFISYLQEEVYKAFESLSLDADLGKIAETAIQNALLRLSQATDTKEGENIKASHPGKTQEAIQAFTNLYEQIKVVQGNSFFTNVSDLFRLQDYIEEVKQQLLTEEVTRKSYKKMKPKGGIKLYKGTLQEIFDAAIGSVAHGSGGNSTIKWDMHGEQVGGRNFKPDVILANTTIDYTGAADAAEKKLKGEHSVRVKGIETMRQLFDKMKNAKGDIVLISNKNYVINEMFKTGTDTRVGGFTAQGDTSLNNLDALFSAVDLPNVDGLIDYLANAGTGMIAGDIDGHILDVISSKIAYFLFDDISITPPSGLNVVHVFNLSGVYVPMSFLLEGVIQGIRGLKGSNALENYVEVVFKSSPTDAPDWNKNAFDQFRQDRMDQTTISVHFLKDFAQVISSAINI